jgi:putative pyoverdin transport system ATP-binding/permease protein
VISLSIVKFLNKETAGSKLRVVVPSLVSGLARGSLLATFNTAAAATAGGGHEVGPRLMATFAGTLALYLAAAFASRQGATALEQDIEARLRIRLCDKLLFADLRFLESYGIGEILTNLGSDVSALAQAAGTFLGTFQNLVISIFALAYLGWLSPPGLVGVALTTLAAAMIYYAQQSKILERLERTREKGVVFQEGINDLVRGFKELKLSRAGHVDLFRSLSRIAAERRDLIVGTQRLYAVSDLTSEACMLLLVGMLVFLLPTFFSSSSTTVFQFLVTVLFAIGAIEGVITSVFAISRARMALGKITTLEETLDKRLIQDLDRRTEVDPLAFRTIALRDVHFCFGAASAAESFDLGPIDMELHRGEALFICGGNGAGKTTLLKLITGLYAPTAGAILVDGRKIESHDRQRYREIFTAVFSDFHLFRRLYGIDATRAGFAERLLAELRIDHKTSVRNGAFTTINLSSGQRKRLAFAVGRMSDRQVYVFDEFAADQDPEFRIYFYSEILPELKRQGKTVIAVTHDDRWFNAGDRLIKMEYGRIASAQATKAFGLVAGEGVEPSTL